MVSPSLFGDASSQDAVCSVKDVARFGNVRYGQRVSAATARGAETRIAGRVSGGALRLS